MYISFIKKSLSLLRKKGVMIFILPSSFLRLTNSNKILINLLRQKYKIKYIQTFHDEKLFRGASIDVIVIVIKKIKNIAKDFAEYQFLFDGKKTIIKMSIPLTISYEGETEKIGNYFDVMVGIVSGCDKIYKNEIFGNKKIIVSFSKNIIIEKKFILITKFPTSYDKINDYLLEHKEQLKKRKIRKFNEKNWFEWGALRNFKKMKKLKGKECIFVKTITRDRNIAIKHHVSTFGASLLILIPKKEINLVKFVEFLNSTIFIKRHTFSGRFKIGQKELFETCFPLDIV